MNTKDNIFHEALVMRGVGLPALVLFKVSYTHALLESPDKWIGVDQEQNQRPREDNDTVVTS